MTTSVNYIAATGRGGTVAAVGGGGSGGGVIPPPPTPTFRSIGALGTNITATNSTLANRFNANAFYNGARMCKTGQPGVNCNRDATTGWPTEAFYVALAVAVSNGTTTFDQALPPGTYSWSYSYDNTVFATVLTLNTAGANTPNCVGISGFSTGTPVVTGSTTKVPFTFTLATGGILTLSFSGPITFCDCPFEGQATVVGGPAFSTQSLAYYSQNSILRTLDMLNGGGRTDILWADRPPNYTGPQLAQDVLSWERVIDFVLAVKNYPGSSLKKWMVNVPPYCDPSYATSLAQLFNSKVVPAGFVELEYGNEPWNFGGTGTIRFHGYENAAFNVTNGLASYELLANASGPTTLFRGLGQTITGMSLDTTGNVTVTLNTTVSSFVDYTTGLPYITNGATLIVSAANPVFNALGVAANTTNVCTVTSVGTSSFVYNNGLATTTANSTLGATQMYFNVGHSLLADNLGFSVSNMQKKWYISQAHACQQNWVAIRSKATYGDKWYLNLQNYGGTLPGQNKTPPFEYSYANYLGGGSANTWLDAIDIATYSIPAGTITSVDDLFLPSTGSVGLYSTLQNATNTSSVINLVRAHVYEATINGLEPSSYEGGIALQSATSTTFAIPAATDPRTEVYLTAHVNVVLQSGVSRYMNYHGSPRTVLNDDAAHAGNNSWQSLQAFNDSITSGDSNYSARKAALDKYNAVVTYSNWNGSDLTTLPVNQYQVAGTTINRAFTVFIQGTTGALYWGTGGTAYNRIIDWVYCVSTTSPRQIYVNGTDAGATVVKLIAYPPDLSGPITIGTTNLPANGVTNSTTASVCADAASVSWTPSMAGAWIFRVQIDATNGTGPGIHHVRFG